MFERLIPFNARRKPDGIALWVNGEPVSYARFNRDIDCFAAAFEREGCAPGSVALIQYRNIALRWVIALALERLDIVFVNGSASFAEWFALVKPDIVLADQGMDDVSAGARVLRLDDGWISAALAQDARPRARRRCDPDDLITVIGSSGTTGVPKKIPLTRELIDRRLTAFTLLQPNQSRTLTAMGAETSVGFFTPLSAWWQGGQAMLAQRVDADLLRRFKPTVLSLSPYYLNAMTREFPQVFTAQKEMVVEVTGGAVTPALAARLQRLDGATLTVAYGSTEASVVAHGPAALLERHPGAVGYVVPWAQVQIMGPDGKAAAPGESGEVRLRSRCLTASYLDDPDATAATFKDGWFHPRDRGFLTPDGVLVIEGRIDDVINLDGRKFSAAQMEEAVLECPGVEDAAIAALPMSDGAWALHCAVVPGAGFEEDAVKALLLSAFKARSVVVRLASIPRNQMNKVQRNLVKAAIVAALAPRAAVTAAVKSEP